MIIVAGRITVRPEDRDAYVKESQGAVETARATPGCLDFVVTADPIDVDRVNVFERWESEEALAAFRGEGPSGGLEDKIMSIDVDQYEIPDRN